MCLAGRPTAGKFVSWYRPATLAQLLELRTRFPAAKMVVGNTEVCVLCMCMCVRAQCLVC